MAKVVCKGTVFAIGVSGTFASVAQVISLDTSGEETETFDSTTLDNSTAYKTYLPTGFVEPGDISGEMFYDPALAGHATFIGFVPTPYTTAAGVITLNKAKITFADVTPTSLTTDMASLSIDRKVAMNDGLKLSFKIKRSGAPS